MAWGALNGEQGSGRWGMDGLGQGWGWERGAVRKWGCGRVAAGFGGSSRQAGGHRGTEAGAWTPGGRQARRAVTGEGVHPIRG